MTVLIDTTIFVDHLRDEPRAKKLIRQLYVDEPAIWAATPTRTEILAGLRGDELLATRALFNLFSWIDIDVAIADAAGDLARRYRKSHSAIDTSDYLIAAATASIDAQLVTLNVRHYPMFEGLKPPY